MFAVHDGKDTILRASKNSDLAKNVSYLEDIGSFSCGYSSNLMKSGGIECEAVVIISNRYRCILGGVNVADRLKSLVKVVHTIATVLKREKIGN
uniref:Roadblock/LC7 domain-containing protein n=1 Tax=Strongyloides papillosus TaxID=174720 RepID=A0A0N5C6E4_STREA